MRVMVDTNVIISAILKIGSLPDQVLNNVCEFHELVLCDYILSESYDVASKRFPKLGLENPKVYTPAQYRDSFM